MALNYKHLHYFWVVATEGTIARAGERLHLTPQTISGQLSALEDHLQTPLFQKSGRTLQLTDTGRMALSYADEIFSLGGELEEMLRSLPEDRPLQFRVGVVDVVPKLVAYRLLAPALQLDETVRISCREGSVESLLADLSVHRVDMVLAENPMPQGINVKGFSHFLGDSGVTFFAAPEVRKQLKGSFPDCLSQAPLLLPGETTVLRRKLLQWLDSLHVYPRIVGDFDDSALMKAFGEAGTGVFIAPTSIAGEMEKRYGVKAVGHTDEVREQYYAISVERKISHPAISMITNSAKEWLG